MPWQGGRPCVRRGASGLIMCEAEGEDVVGGKNHDEQESKVSSVTGYWFLGGSRRRKFELLSSWRCILL